MLSIKGLTCKTYTDWRETGCVLEQRGCPKRGCPGQLGRWGGYWRYVAAVLMWIQRLRCSVCGATHAVLPEELCAYRDATLQGVEVALEQGQPARAAKAAEQDGPSGKRRVRRWVRALSGLVAQAIVGLLPAVEGPLIEKVWAVVGREAGALVRLRHWLWERHNLYFGGPSGLYRGGCPRFAVRGAPT